MRFTGPAAGADRSAKAAPGFPGSSTLTTRCWGAFASGVQHAVLAQGEQPQPTRTVRHYRNVVGQQRHHAPPRRARTNSGKHTGLEAIIPNRVPTAVRKLARPATIPKPVQPNKSLCQ